MGQFMVLPGAAPAQIPILESGATASNRGPSTVFYGRNSGTSATTNDGSLAPGASVRLYGATFFYLPSGAASEVQTQPLVSTNIIATSYGVTGDGITDDTAAIQMALNAAAAAGGAQVVLPAGTCVISSTLQMPSAKVALAGQGKVTTTLQPKTTFSAGTPMIQITSDNCAVRDLAIQFASSTSASNPAGNAIQVTGGRYAELRFLDFSGVNGYAIEVAASASQAPFGAMLNNIHALHTAGGIHLISNNTGSNGFGMQAWLSNINMEICDTLDGLLIEDCNDVLVQNINGAAAQGAATNSTIHVKGAASSVFISNADVGVFPGAASAPTVLIESGPNGSPSGVEFSGGVIQAGQPNISVSSGASVKFSGVISKSARTHGADITGATGEVSFDACTFQANNQANGTSYDMQISMASNFVYARSCTFISPVGSGAGLVTNPVNDSTHRGYFLNCAFAGTGNTPSTVFNGTPQIVRSCSGYNPRGSVTPPTITASPFNTTTSQQDVVIVFTAINTLTAFAIGGTNIGIPVANVGYRLPARQALTLTYSGAAPTWVWLAD